MSQNPASGTAPVKQFVTAQPAAPQKQGISPDKIIDPLGRCIFCLNQASPQPVQVDLSKVWPNLTSSAIPEGLLYVVEQSSGGKKKLAKTPPMCERCKEEVVQLKTILSAIQELEKKLETLRKESKSRTQKLKEEMEHWRDGKILRSATTSKERDRFKDFLTALAKLTNVSKSNTAKFLWDLWESKFRIPKALLPDDAESSSNPLTPLNEGDIFYEMADVVNASTSQDKSAEPPQKRIRTTPAILRRKRLTATKLTPISSATSSTLSSSVSLPRAASTENKAGDANEVVVKIENVKEDQAFDDLTTASEVQGEPCDDFDEHPISIPNVSNFQLDPLLVPEEIQVEVHPTLLETTTSKVQKNLLKPSTSSLPWYATDRVMTKALRSLNRKGTQCKANELRARARTIRQIGEIRESLLPPPPPEIASSVLARTGRTVTLPSGITTTELDPRMTLEERIQFLKATKERHRLMKPPRKPPKPPKVRERKIMQFCGSCRVRVNVDKMPEHMAEHFGEFAFMCPSPKCGFVFPSDLSKEYFSHLINNNRRKCWAAAGLQSRPTAMHSIPRSCETCGETFTKITNLASHLKRHETLEKNFVCPVTNCGKEFTIRQCVSHHIRTAHGCVEHDREMKARVRTCEICNKKLLAKELESHLKGNHELQDDQILRCNYCPIPEVFSSWEQLITHLRTHLSNEGFGVQCDLCATAAAAAAGGDRSDDVTANMLYFNVQSLRRHLFEEHSIGSKFICEHESCEFSCFSKGSLKVHAQKEHVQGKFEFKCEECPESFQRKRQLEAHRIEVHNADMFQCRFCPKQLNSTLALQSHERKHEGKKRSYPCHICGLTLGSNKSYQVHLRTVHTLEKKWKCDKCDMTFKLEESLKRHFRNVHDEERPTYMCEVCGRSLKEKSLLKQHMRIHSGERPFQCMECGLRFRQIQTYKTHMKSHKLKGDKFKSPGTFERGVGYKKVDKEYVVVKKE